MIKTLSAARERKLILVRERDPFHPLAPTGHRWQRLIVVEFTGTGVTLYFGNFFIALVHCLGRMITGEYELRIAR